MRRRVTLFLILFGLLGTLVPVPAFAMDEQVRVGLQKLLDTIDEDHKKLDTQLTDALKDMQNTEVNSGKAYLLETTLLNQEAKVTSVRDQLAKNHQVIEFLND